MSDRRQVRDRGRRIFAVSMVLSVAIHVALFALLSGRVPVPAGEEIGTAAEALLPDPRPRPETAIQVVNVLSTEEARTPSAAAGARASGSVVDRSPIETPRVTAPPSIRRPAASLHLAALERRPTELPLADVPARGVVLRGSTAAYRDDDTDFRPASEAARDARGDERDRGRVGGPVIIRGGGGDCAPGGTITGGNPFPGRIGGRVGGIGGRRFP